MQLTTLMLLLARSLVLQATVGCAMGIQLPNKLHDLTASPDPLCQLRYGLSTRDTSFKKVGRG